MIGWIRSSAGVLFGMLVITACGPSGSGTIVTESRSVGDFTGVEVGGGIDLQLTVDPGATTEVSVTFDDNLLEQIGTEVNDGILVVAATGSYRVSGGGRFVTVVVPSLTLLDASGGSDVTGAGETDSLNLEASGGSDVDLSNLTVRQVVVDASGGADATVTATESVIGDASGGSEVTILGNPTQVDVETSGGADVHS
jgi:hypothetical protein